MTCLIPVRGRFSTRQWEVDPAKFRCEAGLGSFLEFGLILGEREHDCVVYGDLDEWVKEIWKADTLTIVGMRVGTYEGNKAPKKLEMVFNAKTLRAKIVEASKDDVGEVAVLLRAGVAKVQVKK